MRNLTDFNTALTHVTPVPLYLVTKNQYSALLFEKKAKVRNI